MDKQTGGLETLNPLPFERGEGDYLWRRGTQGWRTSENSKQESGRPYPGLFIRPPLRSSGVWLQRLFDGVEQAE